MRRQTHSRHWGTGLLLLLLFFYTPSFAQPALVLPSNGRSVQEAAPQGGLRFQRHMYLITPAEMQQTAFSSGMPVNGIGFTFAAAQSDTTRGQLKVYLQNTTDVVSRRDTNWILVPSTSNSLTLDNLASGKYEWQVQTVCAATSSTFSPSFNFETADPDNCNATSNLTSSQITTSSALLEWSSPISNGFDEYLVEYAVAGSGDWVSTTTTETQVSISGLAANTIYQWRVQTLCINAVSNENNASFSTLSPGECNPPTALQAEVSGDNEATIRWEAATDATRYDIQYRVAGSTAWLFGISFSDSLNLVNLQAGTTYEWRVRTVCEAGTGTYQNGPNLTTAGTATCLFPSILSTQVLTDTSATLSWQVMAGATSYVVRYRLKDAISWTNATQPMSLVHNAEVLLPDTIGDFHIPFQGTGVSDFTYNGGGIYVAWEYSNPTAPTASPNNALATTANTSIIGSFGQDSLQLVLSLVAPNDMAATAHEDLLFATNLRPATFLSSTALNDVVSVEVIHALGHVAPPFSSPSPISAVVENRSGIEVNTTVTLNVKSAKDGSTRFADMQNVSLAPNSASIIAFNIWEPTELGIDSLCVSVPVQANESIIGNNESVLVQTISQAIVGYPDNSPAVTNTGFGEAEGLILSRLAMNGCGRVNAAQVYLDASATNQSLYAVVLDANGNRVDSSAVFIPDSTEVDHYHSFFFPNQPFFTNSFYYIGLAQSAHAGQAVFPVGVQWETEHIQDSAYFRANLDGSNLQQVSLPGRLMMKAEVLPTNPTPVIVGASTICPGTTVSLSVGQLQERFANQVIGVSSAFTNTEFNERKVLGTPDLYPEGGPRTGQWISQTGDGQREYIELAFPAAAPINYIRVYETFNPGSIDTLFVLNPGTGNFEAVYTATAAPINRSAHRLDVEFPLTAFPVDQIRIALASNAVPGFNGIDAVSIGEQQETSNFSNYTWSTGESTATIEISTPGQYSVSVTDGNACPSSTSISVQDPNQSRPGITILDEQPTSFCEGESITLLADEGGDIVWSTGDSTSSITATASGTYFYTQTTEGGCGQVNSDSIVVTVYPLPEIALPAVTAICIGEDQTLDAGSGFTTYQWSTGSIQQVITISTADTYTVTVSDGNNCENSASTIAIFTPAPAPQIVGDLDFCPGTSTSLQVNPSFAQYQWSDGSTTASIEVNTGGVYEVTVVDENGCSGSTSAIVTALEAPTPVISGNLSFCAGNTTTLDVGQGFNSYIWSTGETSPAIIVDTVQTFSVTVTDANGCTGVASAMTSENGALPVSPGPITGPSIGLCQTTGNVYSIDPVPNTTHYVWTVPEGDTIISGQGTTSITVNSNNLSAGYIVVAASNACGQSPSISPSQLFVQGGPGTPGPISGPTSGLCNSTGNVYSIATVSAANGYQWAVPEGATIVDGQGTSSVVVDFGDFTNGEITVSSFNNCGTNSAGETRSLLLEGAPQLIAGREIVIVGNTFTIAPISGADSYLWEVPTGVEILSGQGSNSIEISLGAGFSQGSICVTAENTCGVGETICSIIPLQAILDVCQAVYIGYEPGECATLAPIVQGGKGSYSYVWNTGETEPAIEVCPEEMTSYQLTVTDEEGHAITVTTEVEVYDIRCGVYNTFVEVCWSSGLSSTRRTLCVTQSRVDYYLGTGGSLGNCELISCTGNAGGLIMEQELANFTELDQGGDNLSVFPNPTHHALTLNIQSQWEDQTGLQILDANGKVVRQLPIEIYQGQNTFELQLPDLPSGIYFLQIDGSKLRLQDKFIKL